MAIDEAERLLTVVCCQASWSATSFGAVSLGDDGWDDATGTPPCRSSTTFGHISIELGQIDTSGYGGGENEALRAFPVPAELLWA